jgi:hypothetical protein
VRRTMARPLGPNVSVPPGLMCPPEHPPFIFALRFADMTGHCNVVCIDTRSVFSHLYPVQITCEQLCSVFIASTVFLFPIQYSLLLCRSFYLSSVRSTVQILESRYLLSNTRLLQSAISSFLIDLLPVPCGILDERSA